MKPSIFHRFLLVVLTLLGMVVGLLLLVMATGLYPLDTLRMGIDAYRTQLGTLNFALVMGGTGVVLFLLSLAILVGFNRGDRTPAQPPVTSALVSAGDYGTTQIALSAIDAMVQRHCKTNVRIREVASVITLQETALAFSSSCPCSTTPTSPKPQRPCATLCGSISRPLRGSRCGK